MLSDSANMKVTEKTNRKKQTMRQDILDKAKEFSDKYNNLMRGGKLDGENGVIHTEYQFWLTQARQLLASENPTTQKILDEWDRLANLDNYKFNPNNVIQEYAERHASVYSFLTKNLKIEAKNKIELSTRRNILDGFIITRITWYGNLEQANFLGRLFDLSKLPSTDHRYKTADEDIWKHTVANNDWTDEWVFTDRRFNFLHIEDKLFLEFLCQTIHPTVRDSQDQVVTLLEIYNNNLSKDGYELFQSGDIAGRPIFSAREIKAVSVAASKPHKETKLALVIGCSEYIHAGVLSNPLNDANSIEIKLQSLGFDVIKVLNPSQKELKKIIDDFGDKLKGYNIGLFYFAGHGVQVKGMNYLIPVDANLKTERMVEYDCVEASRVLGYMEDSKSQVNIVILDACRDNPFERSWGRGISQRGLTTMNAPSGSLIAYSTSPGKTASDGDGGNGLYTFSLLEHIGSKQVRIMTMFQNVRKDVMTKSSNEQIPWEATSLTSDYYFNP